MGEKGEGSGGEGGGKWGRRGREVGGKGEGTGNGVPPCPPPQNYCHFEEYNLELFLKLMRINRTCFFSRVAQIYCTN